MVKEDIINEIISRKVLVSTEKNFLQLFHNIDISMYGARAWAFTLQEISLKGRENYLFECGRIMGREAAEEINDSLKKQKVFLPEKFQLLPNIIEVTGFGVINLIKEENNLIVRIEHNQIIALGKEKYKDKSLICSFYRGIYSSFIEIFLGIINCELKEIECICKGGKKCLFEIKNAYNK